MKKPSLHPREDEEVNEDAERTTTRMRKKGEKEKEQEERGKGGFNQGFLHPFDTWEVIVFILVHWRPCERQGDGEAGGRVARGS